MDNHYVIRKCFETPDDIESTSIKVSEIYYDNDAGDFRIQILDDDIPPSHDWSVEFARLFKNGYIVTAMTFDRYVNFIFIWVHRVYLPSEYDE